MVSRLLNFQLRIKVVLLMVSFPARYTPIQKFAPQDCVASVNAIVDKMDQVFDSGDREAVRKMKAVFGLEDLGDGDFAQTIAFPSMTLC